MFLSFMVKFLKITSAISENKSKEVIYFIILVLSYILILGGLIPALFDTTEITYLTVILGIFFCSTFCISLQIITKLHEKKLRRIIKGLLSEHPNFPDFVDKSFTEKAETATEQKYGTRILILVLSLSLYLICPLIYFLIQPQVSFEDPNLQPSPFFYSFWKTPTAAHFICKTMLEMLIASSNIIAYWNFVIFMIYVVYNLEMHIQHIHYFFKNAIDVNIKMFMENAELKISGDTKCDCFIKYPTSKGKHDFVRSFNQEFVKLIKYQQFLHSYISDIASFLNKPFTAVFTWYIISTVLFSYAFLQVSDNYLFILKIVFLMCNNNLALFIFCDAAEVIHHMNEKIIDSLYNTKWYYLSPKSRKDLALILTLCQKKYEVKCFGMYVVNLNLFIYALKNVYSALNIMMATQKK